MELNSKIYVAGNGLVGSAIYRMLLKSGYTNIVTCRSDEVDLTKNDEVIEFFDREKPEYVFLAAAKVGGILANILHPAEFIYNNLQIQNNVIDCCYQYDVNKLLFLGSSCIYPKVTPQPIRERYLLSSSLEETNEAYAIAKIAGIKMCQSYNKQYGTNFISVMPTNLYGPNDNYHIKNSHVIPAMIRRFHNAKINNESHVTIWGTGNPKREFLYSDDLAQACIFLMNIYDDQEIINIGSNKEVTIFQLANIICEAIGYQGSIVFDTSKPDGIFKKLLDCSKINSLGWTPKIDLSEGIKLTYNDFLNNTIRGL